MNVSDKVFSRSASSALNYISIYFYDIVNENGYYIYRCDLWGFIPEINSGISHVRYQFFPPELPLHNYKCGGYIPCCALVNTHTIVN